MKIVLAILVLASLVTAHLWFKTPYLDKYKHLPGSNTGAPSPAPAQPAAPPPNVAPIAAAEVQPQSAPPAGGTEEPTAKDYYVLKRISEVNADGIQVIPAGAKVKLEQELPGGKVIVKTEKATLQTERENLSDVAPVVGTSAGQNPAGAVTTVSMTAPGANADPAAAKRAKLESEIEKLQQAVETKEKELRVARDKQTKAGPAAGSDPTVKRLLSEIDSLNAKIVALGRQMSS